MTLTADPQNRELLVRVATVMASLDDRVKETLAKLRYNEQVIWKIKVLNPSLACINGIVCRRTSYDKAKSKSFAIIDKKVWEILSEMNYSIRTQDPTEPECTEIVINEEVIEIDEMVNTITIFVEQSTS